MSDKDTIYRQDAIDALDGGAELLKRVLDDTDIVGAERRKYKWGLGLIESCISDMKDLPSAEPDADMIHLQKEQAYMQGWEDAKTSAQPEQIIRCENCRFFKRNIPCIDGHYNGCEMWLDDGNEIRVMTDDYCSKALPKESEQE